MIDEAAILNVKDLCAGYGEFKAVRDFSVSLKKGETLCLVGESGCGKSTVLKSLLGIAPKLRIFSGEICIDGVNLNSLSKAQRYKLCCEKMGMVFQNPGAAFNPIRSYRNQFTETLKSHGKYNKQDFEKQAEKVFAKLGLQDCRRILSCCPYELSGGMNQRMALALILLLGQEILLEDEPTSALDATIQLQVAKELKSLQANEQVTQIIVTHNLALARFLADSIGVMYAGRLIEYGDASSVLSNPCHPYTKSLMDAVPCLNGKMPKWLEGQPPLNGPKTIGCELQNRCPKKQNGCLQAKYKMYKISDNHFMSCCAEEENYDNP